MFLVRSAFWLTVAFIALRPHDVDLGRTATALSDQAMAAGQRMVAEQVLNNSCAFIRCQASAAQHAPVRQAAPMANPAAPPVAVAMQASPAVRAAPVPRPRPAWLS